MRLKIEHRTEYRYGSLVAFQDHRLILTPRDSAHLTTFTKSLECVPAASIAWTMDVFGNEIATASFDSKANSLSVTNTVEVDLTAREWPIFAIEPHAHRYPFAYSLDDVVDLGALAQPDWLTPGGETVANWTRGFVLGPITDTLSLLKDLNSGILSHVTYRVRDEEGTQSPAETLALASGSCRDIAALFIEAVRHLGIGARAVSGYFFDADQTQDDAGSTHAWAEVYLPGAGWIAFDPTHRRVGSAHLIPVAYARFNRQIMPISGAYIGSTDAFVSMEVLIRVRPIGN